MTDEKLWVHQNPHAARDVIPEVMEFGWGNNALFIELEAWRGLVSSGESTWEEAPSHVVELLIKSGVPNALPPQPAPPPPQIRSSSSSSSTPGRVPSTAVTAPPPRAKSVAPIPPQPVAASVWQFSVYHVFIADSLIVLHVSLAFLGLPNRKIK